MVQTLYSKLCIEKCFVDPFLIQYVLSHHPALIVTNCDFSLNYTIFCWHCLRSKIIAETSLHVNGILGCDLGIAVCSPAPRALRASGSQGPQIRLMNVSLCLIHVSPQWPPWLQERISETEGSGRLSGKVMHCLCFSSVLALKGIDRLFQAIRVVW